MGPLKFVMTVQTVVLLVPRYWTVLTQQTPLPENYIPRAVGIAFLILSYLGLKIVAILRVTRGSSSPLPSYPRCSA